MEVARWEGVKEVGKEVRGLKTTNRYLQHSNGDLNYSIGNREAKEVKRMTHGQEQWCGDFLRVGVLGRGGKGDKIRITVIA